MHRPLAFLFSFFCFLAVTTPLAHAQIPPLMRGINLSNWLGNAMRQDVTDNDLDQIKKAGFDHVRLPVDPEQFGIRLDNNSDSPGAAFKPVDAAIKQITSHGLIVILDIHPQDSFRDDIENGGSVENRFADFWSNLASHYKNVSSSMLVFELLNEPQYYRSEESYNTLVKNTITAIRQNDKTRTIIIGAPRGSAIEGLSQLRIINDPNILYSFHFYEPYMITHQGIHMGFENLMLRYFQNLPYPANRATQDAKYYAPNASNQKQAANELQAYRNEGWDARHIAARIKVAADWARKNGVKLYCGEFGVLRNHIDADSRYRWINDTRTALENNNIAWSLWDYSDLFGIVSFQGATRTDSVDGSIRFAQSAQGAHSIEAAARAALGLNSGGTASAGSAKSAITHTVLSTSVATPASNVTNKAAPDINDSTLDSESTTPNDSNGDTSPQQSTSNHWGAAHHTHRNYWHKAHDNR